jgi:AraC family transcriptional regulator
MKFAFGGFFGTLRQRVEVAGIGLSETVYGAHAQLPLHAHESPYFCLVLRGDYVELCGRRQRQCQRAMLVFHPAGETHANRFGAGGGTCFNLEFGPTWAERVNAISPCLDAPSTFTDHATAGLAARMRREWHLMDDVSALAIESLALEILVAAARRQSRETARRPPLWLKHAEELIRARHAEPLTLREIAAATNRHPVHVAREFRRHHGCTIGDYIRRLRIDSACHRLVGTDDPLVMIALACGFAGQAHFSSAFKRAKGMSPLQYRDSFHAR